MDSGDNGDLDGFAALSNLRVCLLLCVSEGRGDGTRGGGEDQSRVLGLNDWSSSIAIAEPESVTSIAIVGLGLSLS